MTLRYLAALIMLGSGGKMKLRKCDTHGCGHYGASRGVRRHNGVDILTPAGAGIASPVSGRVTHIGLPYANSHYRYVQITTAQYNVRLFYVLPEVEIGQIIGKGEFIGTAQDLDDRYPGIPNHIHLEIKQPDGDFIDSTAMVLTMVTE